MSEGEIKEPGTEDDEAAGEPSEQPGEVMIGFTVDDAWFGLPAYAVQEVCGTQEASPIPSSPNHVPGMMSLRGSALPLLDLGLFFGLAEDIGPRPVTDFWRVAVVSAAGMRVGILCQHVGGTVLVPRDRQPTPLGDRVAELSSGSVQTPNGVLTVLNIEGLLVAAKIKKTDR